MAISQAFLTQNQSVEWSENALPMCLKSVNDKSEFDLLTLRFENAKLLGISMSFYAISMRGLLNYQLQFARGMLLLASDLDLKFKVK